MLRPLLLSALVFSADQTNAGQELRPIQDSAYATDPAFVDARCRAFLFQAFIVGTFYRGHRGTPKGRTSYEAFRFAHRIRNMKSLLSIEDETSKWSVKAFSEQYNKAFGPFQFPEAVTSTPLFQQDRRTCAGVIDQWTR